MREPKLKFNFDSQNLSQIDINSFSVIDFGVNAEVDDQMSLEIGFVPS